MQQQGGGELLFCPCGWACYCRWVREGQTTGMRRSRSGLWQQTQFLRHCTQVACLAQVPRPTASGPMQASGLAAYFPSAAAQPSGAIIPVWRAAVSARSATTPLTRPSASGCARRRLLRRRHRKTRASQAAAMQAAAAARASMRLLASMACGAHRLLRRLQSIQTGMCKLELVQ